MQILVVVAATQAKQLYKEGENGKGGFLFFVFFFFLIGMKILQKIFRWHNCLEGRSGEGFRTSSA
ncbi:hypothetical protein EG871_14575 [Enterococcus faecium]|nr:hypothetical protein EG871_14575 [Enterococcus faecium]